MSTLLLDFGENHSSSTTPVSLQSKYQLKIREKLQKVDETKKKLVETRYNTKLLYDEEHKSLIKVGFAFGFMSTTINVLMLVMIRI